MSDTDEAVDPVIQPKHILQYTDDELDQLLENIRMKRMLKLAVYQTTMQKREAAEKSRVGDKLKKKGDQFQRQLDAVDKAFAKLETLVNDIRGLRLQMGLNPFGDE